jgi:hypothetical protein
MRRKLRNLARAISLLVATTWIVLTPLSFWRGFYVIRTNYASNVIVRIYDGRLSVLHQAGSGMPAFIRSTSSQPDSWEGGIEPLVRSRMEWGRALWPDIYHSPIPGIDRRGWFVPTWLVAALFALPVAVRIVRRWRSIPPGNCPRCGYDLRATPDRCPECGATPAPDRQPPHNLPMHRTGPAV